MQPCDLWRTADDYQEDTGPPCPQLRRLRLELLEDRRLLSVDAGPGVKDAAVEDPPATEIDWLYDVDRLPTSSRPSKKDRPSETALDQLLAVYGL